MNAMMKTDKTLRIGILSAAHVHADAYAGILAAANAPAQPAARSWSESLTTAPIPDVELLGVADEDAARGQGFAAHHGIRLFPSYEALLAERPDGVIVCSENARHRALVELAAAASVNVMCEKPLAITEEDARAMIAASERAGVILMTAFPMRFSPVMLEVKALLDRDGLGKVYAVSSTNNGQMPARHRAWFVDKELAGGGAGMDHIVHLADLLRWCLRSEVKTVYARFNRILHADKVDVETGGMVMLTLANGTFATIDCSWSRPLGYPIWGGLSMELVGERGVVTADGFRQNVINYGDENTLAAWLPWGSDADRGMVEEFVAAIREGRAPAVTGEDGLKAVEIVMAAYRSAETGQVVTLRG
jgi:predicted dehydrogenase